MFHYLTAIGSFCTIAMAVWHFSTGERPAALKRLFVRQWFVRFVVGLFLWFAAVSCNFCLFVMTHIQQNWIIDAFARQWSIAVMGGFTAIFNAFLLYIWCYVVTHDMGHMLTRFKPTTGSEPAQQTVDKPIELAPAPRVYELTSNVTATERRGGGRIFLELTAPLTAQQELQRVTTNYYEHGYRIDAPVEEDHLPGGSVFRSVVSLPE